MRDTGWVGRAATAARIDTAPVTRPPPTALVAVAVAASVVTAVGADALLVRTGTAVFPSTSGYTHFRFGDYAALTAIGVVAAGVAWPAVARITPEPRRLFVRLAVVVSVLLLLPDLWLLVDGQPADAVGVLVAMHAAVAVITYNLLVRVAPTGPARPRTIRPAVTGGPATGRPANGGAADGRPRRGNVLWWAMAGLVGVESVLGVAALVIVPEGRPDGWLPATGAGIYLAHAVVGGVLGLAAALLVLDHLRRDRLSLYSALAGILGTAVGGAGGLLAVDQSVRLAGMGLMLLGTLAAGAAYLTPIGFADDPAPLPSAGGPSGPLSSGPSGTSGASGPSGPLWDGDRRGELACTRRHRGPEAGAGLDAEERAAVWLTAGSCPLCPGRQLRPVGSDRICGCCETVYRLLPDDGDGPAWSATPGRRVTRR